MSFCTFTHDGEVATCVACGRKVRTQSRRITAPCRKGAEYAAANRNLAAAVSGRGPGTELKRLLGRLGIASAGSCSCDRHAMQMNMWGCDECQRREDEIVGWLRAEAADRGLPFVDFAGRLLVRRAVKTARQGTAPPAALGFRAVP